MPEKQRPNTRFVGFALLASAAVLLIAGVLIASGVFALPSQTRTITTIALCGAAFVDAVIALKFFLSSSSQ